MIAATRRQAMMGALAVPTLAGLPQFRWQHGEASVLLHDPALAAGLRFAAAGAARGGKVVALAGDRIRLARDVLSRRPALIAGVSMAADALLLEDVAAEAGYTRVALLIGSGDTCTAEACHPGWAAVGRMAQGAGGQWIEALADYAVQPGGTTAMPDAAPAAPGGASVLGWVLAAKA
ncbi:MAG: hypothetical protein RLZZ08_1171 [Pseudomonadota bacterium]|jgi:hypothetical protein